MQPIDRIEWKEHFNKEIQLLEYVSILEHIYVPDFNFGDEDPEDYNNFITINQSEVSPEEWEEMANQPYGVSDVLYTLAKRYNDGAITDYFNYDGYVNNELIQNFIKDLGLDVDKFWFLILFIYDYSWHHCMEGTDAEDTPLEQISQFVYTILQNMESNDPKQGTIFKSPIKLSVSIEGEKEDLIIDNPTAISYITCTCSKDMQKSHIENWRMMHQRNKLDSSTPITDSAYIYYFSMMFLNFFDNQPQVVAKRRKGANYSTKEKDLVCQLIAFTRISNKDCWKRTDNDTLKAFLRQYKGLVISRTINSIYPFNM